MQYIPLISILALFSSIALLWLRSAYTWMLPFAIYILTGIAANWIDPISLLSMAAMALTVVSLRYCQSTFTRFLSYSAIILMSLVLGTHFAPGFNELVYLRDTAISEKSGWSSLTFIADKPLVGVAIILIFLHDRLIRSAADLGRALRSALPIILLGMGCVYLLGYILGYVSFDYSPSLLIVAWIFRNLVFTVIAEEALFRGLIMDRLASAMTFKHGEWVALLVSSVLFGLVHLHGGWEYGVLASVAGLFYGYAMMKSGRIEMAILAHLMVNLGHLLFFSYP